MAFAETFRDLQGYFMQYFGHYISLPDEEALAQYANDLYRGRSEFCIGNDDHKTFFYNSFTKWSKTCLSTLSLSTMEKNCEKFVPESEYMKEVWPKMLEDESVVMFLKILRSELSTFMRFVQLADKKNGALGANKHSGHIIALQLFSNLHLWGCVYPEPPWDCTQIRAYKRALSRWRPVPWRSRHHRICCKNSPRQEMMLQRCWDHFYDLLFTAPAFIERVWFNDGPDTGWPLFRGEVWSLHTTLLTNVIKEEPRKPNWLFYVPYDCLFRQCVMFLTPKTYKIMGPDIDGEIKDALITLTLVTRRRAKDLFLPSEIILEILSFMFGVMVDEGKIKPDLLP